MMMLDFATLSAVCAIVFASAVLRGLTGFGFALAAVPMMSLAIAPESAVTITILLQAIVGLRDIVLVRRSVDWRSLSRLSVGALIGTGPGILLLATLDASWLRIMLAVVVCASLPVILRRPSGGPHATTRLALPSGALSGFFGGAAAMPGPPAIFYFLHVAAPAAVMRASLMVFFFATSLIAIPGLYAVDLLGTDQLLTALVALPFMLLGTTAGGFAFSRTSESQYRRASILVLVAVALAAGVRGLLELAL